MKKVFSIVLAIVVCLSLIGAALAAEGVFVPSITYKGEPEIGTVTDDQGGEAVAVFVDAENNVKGYAGHGCLRMVPVAEADMLPDEAKEELLNVYNALSDGSMTLPYDKVEGINADEMVIRELLHVSVVCTEDHAEALKNKEVNITITFELGVAADDVVVVMSYVDGEWVPAKEVVNNGDGSVTVTFEQLCPVAIAVKA